jgi:hypothetical protein
MGKIKIGLIFFCSMALVLAGIAMAVSNQTKEKAPNLEKIEFIHWRKGYAKPAGKAPKPPACYKFLTPTKVRWTTSPVNYAINPTNPQGLAEDFITSAVFNSAEAWDAATSKELFNDTYTISTGPETAYGVQNYVNSISFGDRYSDPGIIAATTVWYNPATKEIVEFDITFETDYVWGDATVNSTVMDLQNIVTHELGHGVGLGDVYEDACSAVTMYGYSNYGETQKRTLEPPDVKALQTLYGI